MLSKKGALLAKRDRMGWFFVAPFVIGFALLFLPILANSIWLTFQDTRIAPGGGMDVMAVGGDNFYYLLRVNPVFINQLIGTFWFTVQQLLMVVIFSLFIAVILNSKIKGRGLFRGIFFIPVILATGIIIRADAANTLMSAFTGGVGEGRVPGIVPGAATAPVGEAGIALMATFQLEAFLMQLFGFNDAFAMMTVAAAGSIFRIVNTSGVQILIFMAGLQSIPSSIYEAAKIEGCSAWECFWKITLPLISPIILANTIYTVVHSFTAPDNPIMGLMDNHFRMAEYGLLAAIGWFYFFVGVSILAVVTLIGGKMVFYQSKH